MMKKRLGLFILIAILFLAFILRLYRFDNPVADWHSWRQVDTSSVSRNFVNKGFDLLHPTYHDLSNVPSTLDNPQGYRFVEAPIYNVFQAGFYKSVGIFSLEEWGRLVTIISSLLTIVFMYLLIKKYSDEKVALGASFLFATLPYSVYYGRTILPDPMTVTAIMGGIYFFDKWTDKLKEKGNVYSRVLYFVLALVFIASAFLLKPFAVFFILPLVAIAFNKFDLNMLKKWQFWLFAVLAVLPLILWRVWILQFPEGIPQSSWLLNGGNIRFKPSFFYWIFAQRIGGLILGFWGANFLILGILINSGSEKVYSFLKGQMHLFWAFLASSLFYLFVVARGNVQHDYYQILIIPTICIFGGLGIKFFIDPPKDFVKRYISIPLLIISLIFMIAFRWYTIRDFFNVNNPSIIVAGQAVDRLTPKDAKVIANYEGDTTFLYQTNRSGWASYEKEMPQMIKMGASYLVIADPKESDQKFGETYKIVEQTPQYVIFDLHQSP